MMHDGEYGMFFGGGFMWVFGLIIVLIIIGLVKVVMGSSAQNNTGSNAMGILKERYARGEIDKDEYEESKNELEK